MKLRRAALACCPRPWAIAVAAAHLTAALMASAGCGSSPGVVGSAARPPPAGPPQASVPASAVEEPAAPRYRLLEYTGEKSATGLRVTRPLGDEDERAHKLHALLARPFLRWTLDLAAVARQRAAARCKDEPCRQELAGPVWLVVVPGGNRPQMGLALEGRELPAAFYVEINEKDAATLIPHELGHVLMAWAIDYDFPKHPRFLPHTTGAITDDATAFSEGWGIHFETLAGLQPDNAAEFARHHRRAMPSDERSDVLLPASDLLTYAQSQQRHLCILQNCFAYLPREVLGQERPAGPRLLERWTDTTIDPCRVKTLEQLVASEGALATLFFRLATTPELAPQHVASLPALGRYERMLDAMASMADAAQRVPLALAFLATLLDSAPDETERRRVARVALEVLQYTPVLPDTPQRLAELCERARRVDIDAAKALRAELTQRFTQTVDTLVRDPAQLLSAAKPALWIRVPAVEVELAVFKTKAPLVFDLNTVVPTFLYAVPGIARADALAFDAWRREHGGLGSFDALLELGKSGRRLHAVLAQHRTSQQAPAGSDR